VLDSAAVERLLQDHQAGVRRGGDAIWALMNLELWYRTFIDGGGVQTLPSPEGTRTATDPTPVATTAAA